MKKDDDDNCIYIKNGPYDENSFKNAFLDKDDNGDIEIDDVSYKMKNSFLELQEALNNKKRNDAVEILNRKKGKYGLLMKLENKKGQKL